jgi:hypothetical protein
VRIIGGHDYYDSGLAYGQDESVVFVREKEKLLERELLKIPVIGGIPRIRKIGTKKSYDIVHHGEWNGKNGRWSMESLTVVFCGHVYGGIKLTHTTFGYSYTTEKIFWDRPEFEEFLKKLGMEIAPGSKFSRLVEAEERKSQSFANYKLEGDALNAVLENRVVIATRSLRNRYEDRRGQCSFTVNCDNLKDLQFYKVKDAFTAFQEISMFVGGVLPREGNPMASIADEEVRIHKAGFDAKTSFRHPVKLPHGRKQRKKQDA